MCSRVNGPFVPSSLGLIYVLSSSSPAGLCPAPCSSLLCTWGNQQFLCVGLLAGQGSQNYHPAAAELYWQKKSPLTPGCWDTTHSRYARGWHFAWSHHQPQSCHITGNLQTILKQRTRCKSNGRCQSHLRSASSNSIVFSLISAFLDHLKRHKNRQSFWGFIGFLKLNLFSLPLLYHSFFTPPPLGSTALAYLKKSKDVFLG